MWIKCFSFLFLCVLMGAFPTRAQNNPPIQIFIEYHPEGDTLTFVNMVTGEQSSITVLGEKYLLLRDSILFQDRQTHEVNMMFADGDVMPHPFIQWGEDVRRIDWTVSDDRIAIAWTVTRGTPSALITETFVAQTDGTGQKSVLVDGPNDGFRAFPVGFDYGRQILYMDYQPDFIGDSALYRQYASLFSINIETQEIASLPGEAGCYCAGGVGAGHFVRLALSQQGFDIAVYNLVAGTSDRIEAIGLNEYTQTGDLLITHDGTRAVYALSQVRGFGTSEQTLQTVFVVVDLVNLTQQIITTPTSERLHPILWTEDNSAILFTDAQRSGTWKLSLTDDGSLGEFVRIASMNYLGAFL